MRPGDLIEWAYQNGKRVDDTELLWSSIMLKWVPIGGTALVVGVANQVVYWLNTAGVFGARVDDSAMTWKPSRDFPGDVRPIVV